MDIRLVETRACPVCRSSSSLSKFCDLGRTSLYQCACGMEFIDPSLDAETMIRIYQSSECLKQINPALENYYEYDTLDPRSRTARDYEQALNVVSALAGGREMLEVGCGTGSFLAFARVKGWKVTGVDSSSENIARLKKAGIDGICSDFLRVPSGRLFDVVVLWDLIEHPQYPVSFVEKSRELLRPGGLLLVATPHYPNLLSMLAKFFYRFSGGRIDSPVKQLYFLEHTTYFGNRTLTALLESHGFKVEKDWKTETDLKRYRFPARTRAVLNILFAAARILRLQNRILAVARKTP